MGVLFDGRVGLVLNFFIVMGRIVDLISDGSGGHRFSKFDPCRTPMVAMKQVTRTQKQLNTPKSESKISTAYFRLWKLTFKIRNHATKWNKFYPQERLENFFNVNQHKQADRKFHLVTLFLVWLSFIYVFIRTTELSERWWKLEVSVEKLAGGGHAAIWSAGVNSL